MPTSLTTAEGCVSSALLSDVTTGHMTPSHPNSKYAHPVSLGVVLHPDHSVTGLGHLSLSQGVLSTPVTDISSEHIIQFTDELNLSSKPSPDGSLLVDDEDDDVRSLLAAAAAVAAGAGASPRSPHLRSSSGLNTPPDSRVGRPLDTLTCRSLKDSLCDQGQGFHSVDNSDILVSHVNMSNSTFVNPGDPLDILLPTSSTDSNSKHFLTPSPTPVPSSPLLAFNSQSSGTPCSSNGLSATHMHSRPPSVMMLRKDLSCESQMLHKDCTQHSFNNVPQYCNSVTTSVDPVHTYASCQSNCNPSFSRDALSSFQSLTPNTNITYACTSSENLPRSPRTLLTACTSSCYDNSTADMNSLKSRDNGGLFVNSSDVNMNNTNVGSWHNTVSDPICDFTSIRNVHLQSSRTAMDVKLDGEFGDVSESTAENLIDLEQVISSHSASLPAEDDDMFIIKTSDNSFDITPTLVATEFRTNTSDHSITPSVITPVTEGVSNSAEPDFPDVYGDASGTDKIDCSNSTLLCHDNLVNPETEDRSPNFKKPASVSSSNSDSGVKPSQPQMALETSLSINTSFSTSLSTSTSTFNEMESIDSQRKVDFGSLAHITQASSIPQDTTQSVTINPSDLDTVEVSGSSGSGDFNDKEEQVYDDEDYAAAAVAAVDDVVFALAGNRKPDPSLPLDPALEGTGTDRIYTLSLAPIQNANAYSQPNCCSASPTFSTTASCLVSNSNFW